MPVQSNKSSRLCLRWVGDDLEPHEKFLGIHQTDSIDANTLVAIVKNCRGQCYDGAANIARVRNGVATQLLAVERRALYTHCYGHFPQSSMSRYHSRNKSH